MTPTIVCRNCQGEIEQPDMYCSRCGEKIDWPASKHTDVETPPPARRDRKKADSRFCPLCGHQSLPEAAVCESCGAALSGYGSSPVEMSKHKARPETRNPLRASLTFLQSWKLPAALGLIGVILVVVLRPSRQESTPGAMPPGHDAIVKEIQELQKRVDSDPKDAPAVLRLANAFYDQKMFPRAVMVYTQYLALNPSDPNARVDMGTSYFELGLADSTHRDEYLATAKAEMEKALTYAPKHQLGFYNLGMVSLHIGDLDGADVWFRKCCAVDSTSEPGKRAQQLLKRHLTTKRSSL